jgi:DNA-binding MarR family transcriptional regulator
VRYYLVNVNPLTVERHRLAVVPARPPSDTTTAQFLGALRQLGDQNLSFTQLAAMLYLHEYPDAHINEVAEALGRSVAATGRLAARLDAIGLLRRTPSRKDRRVTQLRLTAAGRKFVARTHRRRRIRLHLGADLAATLSAHERAVVTEAVQILARHERG